MKILITGSNLYAVLLAKIFKLQNNEFDIYVTTDENFDSNIYTPVNINENDISSILDFVKNNGIDFTVSTSNFSVINGLADVFNKEKLPVFAPFAQSARITLFNSLAKKILYKLKINTPRFGIFDRENVVLDYVRHSAFPIEILKDFTITDRNRYFCQTYLKAKEILQKIYDNNNEKIIIEKYIDSNPINLYFITDGYNAFPLIGLEKEIKEDGVEVICAPNKLISEEFLINILQKTIYPLLDDIAKFSQSYVGIIGLKIKFEKNNYYVLEFYNNFDSYDFQVFLSLLEDNWFKILYDASNGSLADNHDGIKLSDNYSYTLVIDKTRFNNDNSIYSEEDLYISEDAKNMIITGTGLTQNKAKANVLSLIKPYFDENIYKKLEKEEIKV